MIGLARVPLILCVYEGEGALPSVWLHAVTKQEGSSVHISPVYRRVQVCVTLSIDGGDVGPCCQQFATYAQEGHC